MAQSLEELRKANAISPELKEALEKQPFPDLPAGDPIAHRHARAAHLRTLRHLMPIPGPIPEHVQEKAISIEAADGYSINVILYQPTNASPEDRRPLVVLYHEGGWSSGDATDEEFNARLLTKELGVICLNVEYRLAPEHSFPTGISDCWTVLQWAAKNASTIGAEPRRGFIVGGSSAGGNISAVLALLSRDEKLDPPVTGQWLSVPFLIPSEKIPEKYRGEFISPFENKSDPVLFGLDPSAEQNLLAMVQADINSPLFSPIAATYYPPKEESEGKAPLARAFFQIAGMDPLRDHGLVYDRILREEHGVETKVELYHGFGHMFWTNWPEMDTSRKFAEDMVNGFKWLLSM